MPNHNSAPVNILLVRKKGFQIQNTLHGETIFTKGDTRTHAKYIVRKHDSAPVPIAVVQLLDPVHGFSRRHVTAFFSLSF